MVVGVTSSNGRVPSALPPILKNYTKSAIRTQPRDIVAWSCAYFNALANGDEPPVKEQLEFPLPDTITGITPGLLKVIHKKLSPQNEVKFPELKDLCKAMGLKEWVVDNAWNSIKSDNSTRPWDEVLMALIAQEEKTMLNQLIFLMQSITDDPITKGVSAENVLKYFDLMKYSEEIQEDHSSFQKDVHEYLKDVASYQDGVLLPGDLARPSCPLTGH